MCLHTYIHVCYHTGWHCLQGKMLDMVFVVEDPLHWHRENLERNRRHYSCLRWCGAGCVAGVQELPAGLYYNTLVHVGDQVRVEYAGRVSFRIL